MRPISGPDTPNHSSEEPESFFVHAILLSLAAFERLENRVHVELRSNRAPSELHEPDNFITFVSSPLNVLARPHVSSASGIVSIAAIRLACHRHREAKPGFLSGRRNVNKHTICDGLRAGPRKGRAAANVISLGISFAASFARW